MVTRYGNTFPLGSSSLASQGGWHSCFCSIWPHTNNPHVLSPHVTQGSSPFLWASFHPLFQQSKEIFIKSRYEMLKLSIQCTRFESNYSSPTSKTSEDETQWGWNSIFRKKLIEFSEFHPQLNANVLFCRFFFKSHPVYDQTQGSGAWGFPYFTRITLITYLHSDPILYRRSYDRWNLASTQLGFIPN